MTDRYVTKVVGDEESGDLVLLFPEELLKKLALVEGEYLMWSIEDDGKICLTRTNYVKPEETK